jgi:hypothetical protein
MITTSEHTIIVGGVAFQVELWGVRNDETAICSPFGKVGTLFYCVRHGRVCRDGCLMCLAVAVWLLVNDGCIGFCRRSALVGPELHFHRL